MKTTTKTCVLAFAVVFIFSCEKETSAPKTNNIQDAPVNNGPYGEFSRWKSIGGDSLFEEDLTLTLFYTEKSSPCDICHYQLNYSLWNDYEYTCSFSKCAVPDDTLVMTDLATARKAIFKRINN
jgi:hypothetical protein